MGAIPQTSNNKRPFTSQRSKVFSKDTDLYHLAFDNSVQSSIISLVSNGMIIMANDSACKLLGYSKKKLLTKTIASVFSIQRMGYKRMLREKKAHGQFTGLAELIKKNGKSFPCEITSATFQSDGSKKTITTIADISKSILIQKNIDTKNKKIVRDNITIAKSKQKKIDTKKDKIVNDNIILAQVKSDARIAENNIEHSGIFLLTSKLSFDGIWDWNLLTNEFFLGEGFEELFGYSLKNHAGKLVANWTNFLHPDDKESVEMGLQEAIKSSSSQWEDAYRFVKADGSVAKVFGRASIIRDANGKAYRMIGAIHDISKQKILEERLENEIRSKEKQIAEASEEARETERQDIGKELHDNVNQLLGASTLYFKMAKTDGQNSEMLLNRSSEYTLSAIDEIRKLTRVLTTGIIKNFGLCDSIETLTKDMMEVNPLKISCKLDCAIEENVNEEFKLNIFRIVQEQMNNILKHAKATLANISLSEDKKNITLSISDNGVGFHTDKKRKGIGLANIKSRAAAYHTTAQFVSQPGKGCSLIIKFPETQVLKRIK